MLHGLLPYLLYVSGEKYGSNGCEAGLVSVTSLPLLYRASTQPCQYWVQVAGA